jgi:hypothetical protein
MVQKHMCTSEFFFGDRVAFSASDSGSLRKCTNQSQSLPHFVAKKKFTEVYHRVVLHITHGHYLQPLRRRLQK